MLWNLVAGPVLDVIGKVVDKLVPDVAGREKLKLEMQAEMMKMDWGAMMAQVEVNRVESAHASVFVAGWRPFIGWVCGSALAYQFIAQPFLVFGLRVFGVDLGVLPTLDYASLSTVLLGMLGLGGLRTFEKVKGVG